MKLLENKTTDFLGLIASKESQTGGGGASAAVGAFAAALGMMVANLTVGKEKYAEVEAEIMDVREKLIVLMDKLIALTDEDAKVLGPLMRAYGLPRQTKEEQEEKDRVLEEALCGASIVPTEMMETTIEVMRLLKILGEKGSRLALSDVGVGVIFAQAALEGASLNVFINTQMMKNREQAEAFNRRADELIEEGRKWKEQIYQSVLMKLR